MDIRVCLATVLLCSCASTPDDTSIDTPDEGVDSLVANARLIASEGFETSASLSAWTRSGNVSWYSSTFKLGAGSVQLTTTGNLSRTFDVTGYRELTVQVSFLGYSFESGEKVIAEYRTSSASAFAPLATLADPNDDGYFRYFQTVIPAQTPQATQLEIRFRLAANATNDYAYVDNFFLYGQPEGVTTDPSPDCPSCVADFAIYDPYYEEEGVWDEETTALLAAAVKFGWTYQVIDHNDLNAKVLGSGTTRRFRALVAPGGNAYYRNRDVTTAGETGIRDFLNSGGNYVGFCAGSFNIFSNIIWAQTGTGGSNTYNRTSDYSTTPYDLKLADIDAQGPFGWTLWQNGQNASLEPVALDTSNATIAAIGVPAQTRLFYYGGPFFTNVRTVPAGYEVWARAVAPSGAASTIGAGEPTIVKFNYGTGKVIAFSYHPAILVQSSVDGVTLTSPLDERTRTWNTGAQSIGEVNLQSWNLMHAALQIAANEPVTPLTILP